MQPWFMAYIFDIGYPCLYGHLTTVKTRYIVSADRYHLTMMLAQAWRSSRSCGFFFWKLTAAQELIF